MIANKEQCSVFRVYPGKNEKYAALAQLVEQLTLNQWVPGFESLKLHQRPIGQVVKTAASHAVNIGSNPVWVTKLISLC